LIWLNGPFSVWNNRPGHEAARRAAPGKGTAIEADAGRGCSPDHRGVCERPAGHHQEAPPTLSLGRLSWVFLSWNTTNVHFCTFVPERFPRSRVVYAGGANCRESAMPHRDALNIDSADNTAIRKEIGERLQVMLSKDQPKPPPRVQHLLDRLSPSKAQGQSGTRRRYLSWLKPKWGR
jgi:hypothetical protein